MPRFRELLSRSQLEMFPWSLNEYVPVKVRFVDSMIDELDLTGIEAKFSDRGRPAYSPSLLVKLLVYGKLRGIYSSRRLAEACKENVRFMYLCSRETPDFRTISDFRKRFHAELMGRKWVDG